MTKAGTGEAQFPTLRAVLSAATYSLELAIIAAIYVGLAGSAQVLPTINPAVTPLWPPTGVALAIVLLRGYRVWLAIYVGAFFAHAISSISPDAITVGSLLDSTSIGIGTTLAALAGAWLINRWSYGHKTFETPLGNLKFMLISFAPTAMIASAIAVAGQVLGNESGFAVSVFADSAGTWARWWLADAAGTVLIAPTIVLWAMTPRRSLSNSGMLEAAALFVAAAAIGVLASGPLIGSDLDDLWPYRGMLGFLILLPLTWASLRGNQRDAATAALIYCGIAAWGFSAGASPSSTDANGSLVLLLLLATSTSVVPLVLGATIAAHRDTEARLLAAQGELSSQLEQTQSAFKSAKRHFQIFIEGVADYAIFVLDASGHVASWNSTAQHIIGYKTHEIIGKHFGIFFRPDERRAGEPNRALELAIQNGKHEVEGWRIRKNGTPFFITGALTAIRDDNGNLIGLASIIRDATERRDAQEKLVEAREQLAVAQKMEAIGKLTGGIAHDFNNLLMIIGGNAQTFKRLLDPKLPQAIEAIQTAAKRGESLTRQLLTFSRRQHLNPTVVDLNASIRNMRTMIESSLRGNIVYDEKIDARVWPVKVDLAELELAIVNIAVNARDAMPNGGVFTLATGNVTANGEFVDENHNHNADFVAIEFSDTGMGIPRNLLSKIFDPFFTTKEVGKGTGLGLSQVYGFAHQAGGTVQAESKVGQGTTIAVYLPACTDKEIAENEMPEIDAPRSQRPMVLIVDDSAEVAEVTSSLFEHLGYETVYRDSAEAALKLLEEGAKLDLVFSDIVMPGTIDGVGLASEVRAHYPHLPVILTTGYSDAAQAVPPDLRILRKPFDTEALRSSIQDTMQASLASPRPPRLPKNPDLQIDRTERKSIL
jgi:PAS domain S-box-containing protein